MGQRTVRLFHNGCRIQLRRGMRSLAQVAKILNVALRAFDGRIVQPHNGKARAGHKVQKALEHLQMHLRVPDDAFFADLFAPGLMRQTTAASSFSSGQTAGRMSFTEMNDRSMTARSSGSGI